MSAVKNAKVKVILKRSRIGVKKSLRKTLDALGLKKINQVRIYNATPSVMGMLNKVTYLIEFEKVEAKDGS